MRKKYFDEPNYTSNSFPSSSSSLPKTSENVSSFNTNNNLDSQTVNRLLNYFLDVVEKGRERFPASLKQNPEPTTSSQTSHPDNSSAPSTKPPSSVSEPDPLQNNVPDEAPTSPCLVLENQSMDLN